MPSQVALPDNKQKVLEACDIVDVVGDHVALKSKGREFVGLCPFHDDHSPSMYVVPHKQIFHCFVCGAGGNAIDFMMRLHGMGFREALEAMAERSGIELVRSSSAPLERKGVAGAQSSREEIARANVMAMQFFGGILRHRQHGRAARDSIAQRGISPEMVERFHVGAAPDRWDGLLTFIQAKGLAIAPFIDAGLLKARAEGSGHYDALRNRLVFPILDQSGRAIAFGGRRLDDDDEPKYLNSPETPLFDKSATLFGIKQAARAIRQSRTAIICEGYTDVIACHQGGFENALATLGTALTRRHAPILRRMCERVILLFDGDDAGQRAADRALEVFFKEPIDVGIAVLPAGKDPDDLLKEEGGPERFQGILDGATDYLEYRFARLRAQLEERGLRVGSPARARTIEEEIDRLVELGLHDLPPIRRSTVVRKLTRLAGVDGEAIAEALAGANQRRTVRHTASAETPEGPVRPPRRTPLELALGCLLVDPTFMETDPEGTADILQMAAYASGSVQDLAQAITDEARESGRAELPNLLQRLESSGARQSATSLFAQISRETDNQTERVAQYFRDCLCRLKRMEGSDRQDAANDEPSLPAADSSTDSGAPTNRLPWDQLSDTVAPLKERYQKLGPNPLAMPRPRAGPT